MASLPPLTPLPLDERGPSVPDIPRGPIFVVGPAGSGTTLMRLILDSHENIAIAQETGFARVLLANEWVPFWEFGGEWYGRLGLNQEQLERELGNFYGRLFAGFAAQRGATRWGDKTPFHVWHLALLGRVFPDAVFIGMTRHPGAVASSTRRRMRHPWQRSVRFWVRDTIEMLHQGAALGERFVVCRYEDLLTSPEPVLRELFGWLGEPWSDQLLAFHEVHSDRGTDVEVEGATRSDRPLDASRLDAWTTTMTPERWARLHKKRVAALCRLLGYQPGQPLPASSWTDGGGSLLDGTGVRRRMRSGQGIRWANRQRPSLANRPLTVQDLQRLRKRADAGRRSPEIIDRAGERAGDLGRRALLQLPPGGRRRVRALLQLARR